MAEIFLQIINMSISASYIVLAVLLLRFLLKKAPKWIMVVLWGMVAVRLVCPFSFESVLSLIPRPKVVTPTIMTDEVPTINTGITVLNSTINPVISGSAAPTPGASVNPLQIWIPILTAIWIAGMVILLIYAVISYARVKRTIGTAVLYRDAIYQSENVVSPFVLGILKPKIYLPFHINEKDREHVIAHEMAHVRRKDHLWKPLGFLLLTIHWFNPLMWLGYVFLCRDIELACDEKVIRELDHDARADYSQALLTCSVNRRMIAACPLSFGEVGVKSRVRSVLNYKKPAFWVMIVAVMACIVVAICFLTNPPQKSNDDPMLSNADIQTGYEGVSINLWSIAMDEKGRYVFEVSFYNKTDKEVIYGESFAIEYQSGEEWVDTDYNAEIVFDTRGYLLETKKHKTKNYVVEDLDTSKSGTYRLVIPFFVKEGDQYVQCMVCEEFKIGTVPTVEAMQEKFPEYFGIDTSNGLDVYVWQMAKNSYSFGLLPHSEQGRDWLDDDLHRLKAASTEEMRVILSTYDLNENDIHINLWSVPYSSYLSEWQFRREGEDWESKEQACVEYIRQRLLLYIAPVYPYDPWGVYEELTPIEP